MSRLWNFVVRTLILCYDFEFDVATLDLVFSMFQLGFDVMTREVDVAISM